MLREKQPIVIQDRLVDVKTLSSLWFKQNHVNHFQLASSTPDQPVWNQNKYKFMVLHCSEPCEILITSANVVRDKNGVIPNTATLVAIRLSSDQALILPYRMHFAVTHSEKITLQCLGVHDWITYVLP